MADRTLAPAAATARPSWARTAWCAPATISPPGGIRRASAWRKCHGRGANRLRRADCVRPHMTGIGGDLFMLWYDAGTRRVRAINAAGPAPATASIAAYRDRGMTTVPAKVSSPWRRPAASLADGFRPFCHAALRELLQPAIDTARDGFPMYSTLHSITAGLRTLNDPARALTHRAVKRSRSAICSRTPDWPSHFPL